GAVDGDLLEIPVADGPLEAAMGGNHAVCRAVILAWVEVGVLLGRIIEDLELAHADVGGVAIAGVADGQAVVAAGRQLYFQTGHEIAVLVLGVDGASLAWPADDGAILDLVLIHRAGPAGEILAVEYRFKTF